MKRKETIDLMSEAYNKAHMRTFPTGAKEMSVKWETDQNIDTILRNMYPHGHPDFVTQCLAEMKLHSEKNHDYAVGGNPLGNFDRVAAICDMYPNLRLSDPAIVAMVYMLKQLDAYLWMKSNGHEAKVEGLGERLGDVSVYAKIARIIEKSASK